MKTYKILVFCVSVASILLLSCRKTDTKREPVVFKPLLPFQWILSRVRPPQFR